MVNINRLIWNDWNVAHIARHKVKPKEIEEVCTTKSVTSSTYLGRIRLIGAAHNKKILTVILAPKGKGVYYPITARPASRKERKLYKKRRR